MKAARDYILITGGAGYIGAQTNKALYQKDCETLIYDSLIRGHKEFIKWGTFINGDLEDITVLRQLFRQYPIKAVIHFAGYAYVGESVEKPQDYYCNNVKNTLNLLQVILEFGVKFFIFSSSCATYGNPQEIPIKEGHPQHPINPYGKSKLMVEQILQSYSAAYSLKHVVLRYFNAAGADPDGEIGEWHLPETHVIPLALDVVAGKTEKFQIFGTDYPTKDGTCIRDYIHVTDLAAAHVLALEYLTSGGQSDVFNLAYGHGFSVKEIIDAVQDVTGKNVSVVTCKRRPGDPAILIGDAEKAKRILNWKSRYSDLATIIQTAWQWHKKLSNQTASDKQ